MRFKILFMAAWWGILLCGVVSAEAPAYTVVIAALDTDTRDMDTMAGSVRSQLSDVGAEVRVQRVSAVRGGFADKERLAASISRKNTSAMVVLVSEDRLGMYLREADAMTVDERPFPAAESWVDACDASASIIRSVFEIWLVEVAPELPPLKEDKENADAAAEPVPPKKGTEGRREAAAGPGPSPATAGIPIGVGIETDYIAHVARSQRSVLHGAHGGMTLRVTPHVRLALGVDILQTEKWTMNDWRFAMRRIPVRTDLSGQWMWRWLTFGARASFVADITRMKANFSPPQNEDNEPLNPDDAYPDDGWDGDGDGERSDQPTSDDTFALPSFQLPPPPDSDEIQRLADSGVRTFFGLGVGAYAAFRATSWLDIGVAGGCDFYFNSYDYLIHLSPPRAPLMFYRYQRVQPRVMLQLTFWVFER